MAKSRKSNRSKDTADKSAKEAQNDETLTGEILDPETVDADSLTARESSDPEQTPDGVEGEVTEQPTSEEEAAAASEDESGDTQAAENDAELPETETVDAAEADAVEEMEAAAETDGEQGDDSLLADDEATGDQDVDAASSDADTDLTETLEPDAGDTESKDQQEEQPDSKNPAPTPPPEPVRQSGMWPAVFGGIIAALLGFIAGRGDQLDQYLPGSMQRGTVDLSALEADTAALSAVDEDLAARLSTLENAEAPVVTDSEAVTGLAETVASLQSSVTTLEGSVATLEGSLEASLASLADRLAALEDAPVIELPTDGATTDDVAALQSAIDAQRAEIAALAQRAEDAEAKAASEASKILARAALARVMTAVETGETFSPALGDLEDVAPVEVPEPLRVAAESGVPRLADLQSSFPDAARTALAAIRSETPEADVQGIGGFLRRTLSARSVTPREGADPDAVLSRAEAAMRDGDLGAALSELDGLPDAGRAAMQDWLDAAAARSEAQEAARSLSDSLNN